MNDDYSNDQTTTGLFAVGEPTTGVFNSDLAELDSDWFRIALVEGRTYQLSAYLDTFSVTFAVNVEQFGNDGFIEHRRSRGFFDDETGESRQTESLWFTANRSGDFFFSASRTTEGPDHSYTVTAHDYEIPDYYWTNAILEDGVPKKQTIDAFDNFNDRDSFLVDLSRSGTYDFTLKGVDSGAGSLEDPILRIYSGEDGLLETIDGGGSGRDVAYRFVAARTGKYQVSVGSSGDSGTGTYEIEFNSVTGIDDAATGPGTTSRLPMVRNQTRVLEGRLEQEGDIDWHKVNLVATRWYRFSYTSEDEGSTMFIRDPDGGIFDRASGGNGEFYFRAMQSGTHHLVFRNGIDGYTITAVDNEAPAISARHVEFRVLGDERIKLSTLFDLKQFPAEQFLIHSETPFFLDGVEHESHDVTRFDVEDFDRIEFHADAKRGEYDVSIRANADGVASGWATTVLRSQLDGVDLLTSGLKWDSSNTQRESDKVVTFRFADSIPSYFSDGRFTGYSPMITRAKHAFLEMMLWPDYSNSGVQIQEIAGIQFVEDDSEEADIQIFTADLDQHAIGFRPGQFGRGDIVLDNEIYSEASGKDTLTPEEEFQLKRAMLSALGAKHYVGEFGRDQTMMGRHEGVPGNIFPESFGYWDVEYLRATYGDGQPPSVDQQANQIGLAGVEFFRTIHTHVPPLHQVRVHNHSGVVDLRPGATSLLSNPTPNQNYVIGEGVYIYRGAGSGGNDSLFGHQNNNLLEGYSGNDLLNGRGGDDLLFGGDGDDTYVYEMGQGNDTVWESTFQASGTDTLVIRGRFGFGSINDDLTFQRLGDDLKINLALNNNYNRNGGSIIVKDMAKPSVQVERLRLETFTQELDTFSLPAIFAAATSDQQRFASTGESDAFGFIAAPV